jgi:hypothetical protein
MIPNQELSQDECDVHHEDRRLGKESGSILKNALVAFHALTSSRRQTTPAKKKGGQT